MSKSIFILLLLVSSVNLFSQENISKNKITKSDILDKKTKIKKAKIGVLNEAEIDLLLNNNLCEILSIKPSDLLNEEMLKKLRANV
ncbi:hypothetical protein [Flavobacterium aquicola]|uniref:Uncharacterized protein n=1 Tax=Flavobacterium aquicola TaxID=1682742 RepID=A0A3E0EG83_9FLAO|nr:hypothetical protein [Flavobacterium aquicola]REG96076.1 hypothetical protein C8P67_11148 [Flavobacterium aquicola]